MRLAVLAAEHAAGTMARAIARGVALARAFRSPAPDRGKRRGRRENWPSPPEPARNSCCAEMQGKRTSATSRLPNLRPPTECHSPIDDQPSPPDDAPPPGRAWNRCQMKFLPVRGSSPWIAIRNRAAPAGHRAFRTGRRQRLHDRLDDFVRGMAGAQRHRPAGIGPHHRAPAWRSPSVGAARRCFWGSRRRSDRQRPSPPRPACWHARSSRNWSTADRSRTDRPRRRCPSW